MWADLAGANLIQVNLTGANLIQASLIRTDLTGADLSEANLTGAIFEKNLGLTESDKADMLGRGAIFQDNASSQSIDTRY
jgi:uncharacterized protein YjbI with pentapeptide repeats